MADYVICSDVHGSIDSFKRVIDFFVVNKFDKLIILGDLLYHGPRNDIPEGYNPKDVIKLINSLKNKVIMVKGNCESEVDQMVLDFKIFNTKIIKRKGKKIHLVHGHHLEKQKSRFNKGDIVFYGHTHIRKIEVEKEITYINPGSITIPKDNQISSFMVLMGNRCMSLDLNGNVLEDYLIL